MKFGSLFAGIGGIDLGLERAGMECAWQVEIDQQCRDLLKQQWPETERYGDVREYGRINLRSVDLISGGFPCQDVSVAGRRAGLDGKRSGLWFEFHRILAETNPRWVIIENVPGLLSSNEGRDFAVILRGLANLGYGVAYRILDAQYFGVAQRRRRVFIIGNLGSGSAAEVLFESESLSRSIEAGRKAGQKTAGTLGSNAKGGFRTTDLDQQAAFILQSFGEYDERGVASALKERDYKDATDLIAAPLRSRQSPNSNAPGRGGEDDENIVIGFTPGNSAESYGVGEQEEISPPVRGGGAGAKPTIAGNIGVRRLTPTECERLQGFPDGWTDGFADTARYRMLGNAVCVPVAQWIGERILEFDE